MTINQILQHVSTVKPVGRRQIYRYLQDCCIEPLGVQQRPQQYPGDSAARILARLGLVPAPRPFKAGFAMSTTAQRAPRIHSTAELKALKRKAAR